MITVTERIPDFATFHKTLGYSPKSSLFFDIETTGFSPASSVVFLIGAISFENGGWQLTQLLAEKQEEELPLLDAFFALAAKHDTLIHFNGSTFDVPYLSKKAAQYQLSHTLNNCVSIDLYQKYRPLGKLLSLERMKQISLESFLGWNREDRLTGKHMASWFQKYAASDEPGLQKLLLLHNHDDMIGMTHLLQMAAYLELIAGEFEKIENVAYQESSQAFLKLFFTLHHPLPASLNVTTGYRLSVDGTNGTLCIPLLQETMYHFFPDYKNYYYLPLEDEAIHKSVASYVDKAYRTQAKAVNCYIKKSGLFLPQPEELFLPAFKRSYEDQELYFAYLDSFTKNPDALSSYLSSVLRHLSS